MHSGLGSHCEIVAGQMQRSLNLSCNVHMLSAPNLAFDHRAFADDCDALRIRGGAP